MKPETIAELRKCQRPFNDLKNAEHQMIEDALPELLDAAEQSLTLQEQHDALVKECISENKMLNELQEQLTKLQSDDYWKQKVRDFVAVGGCPYCFSTPDDANCDPECEYVQLQDKCDLLQADLATSQGREKRLREALESLEWQYVGEGVYRCPKCKVQGTRVLIHKDYCSIKQALEGSESDGR